MAKYRTKVYADFDHFLQYMENSLNHGTAVPVKIADYTENGVRICIRRFDAVAPVKMLIVMGNTDSEELTVEVYESGVFHNRGQIEGNSDEFITNMENIIYSYLPDTDEEKNSYYWQQWQKNTPEPAVKDNSPEIPGFFDKS